MAKPKKNKAPAAPAPAPAPEKDDKKKTGMKEQKKTGLKPVLVLVAILILLKVFGVIGSNNTNSRMHSNGLSSPTELAKAAKDKYAELKPKLEHDLRVAVHAPTKPPVLTQRKVRYVNVTFPKDKRIDLKEAGIPVDKTINVEFDTGPAHLTMWQVLKGGTMRKLENDDEFWYEVKGPQTKERLATGRGLMDNLTEMAVTSDRDIQITFKVTEEVVVVY